MSIWVKPNRFIRKFFFHYIWEIPNIDNEVYLTFDDGPTEEMTLWILNQLKEHDVKATFFCVGENIQKHPALFQQIIAEGHIIGNHTFNHLNGWKTNVVNYIDNVDKCRNICLEHTENSTSALPMIFRPPYGKLKPSQSKILRKSGYKVIMWDVLSKDYDPTVSPEGCFENVLKNVSPGSIIIFHDNPKAWKNLEYALPKTLELLKKKGYVCSVIE